MFISISRRVMVAVFGLMALAALPSGVGASNKTACFDVRIDYLGRVPVQNISGVQFYRWSYRVTGMNCINRGTSHWTLGLCTQTQQSLSQISQQCTDNADIPDGLITNYQSVIGNDPTTGVAGLKWNFMSGNQINKAGEWDEFSFVASGIETSVGWAAKGGQIVTSGNTIGPGCAPVSTEGTSWGAIKALFRS